MPFRCRTRIPSLLLLGALSLGPPACVRPGGAGQDHGGRRQVQTGFASYYGPGFDGEQTASGEIFDQTELVAAHRTLPFGTRVRVTNLENGRSLPLRIIDRGPYGRNHRKGTIIDVSKAAARRLGFLEDGLVRVSVEVLEVPAGR